VHRGVALDRPNLSGVTVAITKDVNERLTRYGPGTPAGEMFRRYWHPVAVMTELSDEAPTKLVRILGEDLVLFRDKIRRVGLLADHCAHRGASLLYGRVEERGISCAYHGWLYDTDGNCLETPAEPADSHFCLTVKQKAYPVRAHFGLYWAYLGPSPVPALPGCGVLPTWRVTGIEEQIDIQANWLQVIENNVDGTHFPILHQESGAMRYPGKPANTTRGFIDQFVSLEYWEEPFGIMRRQVYASGGGEEDALMFPNIKRRTEEVSIKVPVDDTHTKKYVIFFDPSTKSTQDLPIEHWLRQDHAELVGPDGRNRMDEIRFQDLTVMHTQGAISERENWRLGASDRGIALLHEVLLREIDKVERGLDPIGVIRYPEASPVDEGAAIRLVMRAHFKGHGIRVYPKDPAAVGSH